MYYLLCFHQQPNQPPYVPKHVVSTVGENFASVRTLYHYDTFVEAQDAAYAKMRESKFSHVEIVQAIARIEPQREFKTVWYEVKTGPVGLKVA